MAGTGSDDSKLDGGHGINGCLIQILAEMTSLFPEKKHSRSCQTVRATMDICGNRRREVNIDRQHKCRLRINGASRRAANSTSADLSGQLGPKVAAVLLPCLHLERRIDGRIKNMPHWSAERRPHPKLVSQRDLDRLTIWSWPLSTSLTQPPGRAHGSQCLQC